MTTPAQASRRPLPGVVLIVVAVVDAAGLWYVGSHGVLDVGTCELRGLSGP